MTPADPLDDALAILTVLVVGLALQIIIVPLVVLAATDAVGAVVG